MILLVCIDDHFVFSLLSSTNVIYVIESLALTIA